MAGISTRRMWVLVSVCLCLGIAGWGIAEQTDQVAGEGAPATTVAQAALCGCGGADCERYYTLEVDDNGDIVRGRDGEIQWVPVDRPQESPAPIVLPLAGNEAVVVCECRTTPTDYSGRKSCSDGEVHTLPAGHVFVENEKIEEWHSAIGSENSVNVSFEDRVEVVPGTGIRMARTMRVTCHARSGHGYGERGHTYVVVRCRFVKYK